MKTVILILAIFFSIIMLFDYTLIVLNLRVHMKAKKYYEKNLWTEIILLLIVISFWTIYFVNF